jgi:hypothetical protein
MKKFKSLMKTGAAKILSGALLGLGFSAPFLGIYFYTTNQIQKTMMEQFTGSEEDIKKVEIINHKDKKMEHKLIVLGAVKNNSTGVVKNIKIEVEFFMNGEFVDECTEYIGHKIAPEQVENFKVSCGCSSNYEAPKYDDYTLRVTSISG